VNKNGSYYSFKIQLGSRLEARFGSQVGRADPVNPIFLKKKSKQLFFDNFFFKKVNEFLTRILS
jgi:hypothetical protein